MKSHTLRLFPVVSFRASNPPGPILLLRDFFVGFSIGTALFPLAKAPRSAVIFSWSISCADGIWASDFRDFGRVAGRVTSSREDMIEKELQAQDLCFVICSAIAHASWNLEV
jgi:hypothetical protein